MDLNLTATIVTAAVALYGAILASVTAMKDRAERRRFVVVRLSNTIPLYLDHAGDPLLMIEAANPGTKTIHLTGASILLPNGKGLAIFQPQGDVKFPHSLDEGKSCRVWMETHALARHLRDEGFRGKVRLVGAIHDAVGKVHKSKPFTLDVDDWSKGTPAN